MALKQKQNFTTNIMGGVRKNIEASKNAIENGSDEELMNSAEKVDIPTSGLSTVETVETEKKEPEKKTGKSNSKIEASTKAENRLIKKSVFFDYETNDKLETIKQWRRFKDGMKRVSIDDIIYEATLDWLNRNYEKLEKKYMG